jgi:hypothetical protein
MPDFLGALPLFIGDEGDYMGAARRSRRKPNYGSAMTHAANYRANAAAQFARPDIPGAPARDGALLPAGFPPFAFALANGTNVINQQMNPQTPYRVQRMVTIVIRNGTSAQVTAPLIQFLQVGMKPVITTGFGVPLETFAQTAYDTNVLFPPTIPGVIYNMNVNLFAALTTTDTLTALVGTLGSGVL